MCAITVRWKIDGILFSTLLKTDNHGGFGMTPEKHYVNQKTIYIHQNYSITDYIYIIILLFI